MDIRKVPKENSVRKAEEIQALEYMMETLSIWDKHDTLNMEELNDDAQRNRTQRKSPEALRKSDSEGGTTL